MKKYYACNQNTGEKIFCKCEISPVGVLFVHYYLPKYGFSINWMKGSFIRINSVKDTIDNRKCIVTYEVHPTAWLGESFNDSRYISPKEVIDHLFTRCIKTHV